MKFQFRSLVMLGVITQLASVAYVRADDYDHGKKFRVDVLCKFGDSKDSKPGDDFLGEDGGQDQGDEKGGGHDRGKVCFAAAKLFFTKKCGKNCDGDKDGAIEELSANRNLLSVLCSGKLIYADGAFVERNEWGVKIVGLDEGRPAIVFLKDTKADEAGTSSGWKEEGAFLKVKYHGKIPGTCKIRKEKLEDDYGGDLLQ